MKRVGNRRLLFLQFVLYTTHVMQKDVLIMIAGLLVGILPFLGFPNSWDAIIFVALGVCIIALGVSVRRGNRPRMRIPVSIAEESHEVI